MRLNCNGAVIILKINIAVLFLDEMTKLKKMDMVKESYARNFL